jgi:hypothetical protein
MLLNFICRQNTSLVNESFQFSITIRLLSEKYEDTKRGYSEAVNRGTDNIMSNRKTRNGLPHWSTKRYTEDLVYNTISTPFWYLHTFLIKVLWL